MLRMKQDSGIGFNNSVRAVSPFDHSPDDHEDEGTDNMMGSASDYILIAMIVAMMICMAVCCLCLFCRSSHFTFCGWNFEINNRNTSVNNDDISELHEVVPLTPTSVNTYNITDIEKKLKSDPPPPKYIDVAGRSVLDRLRRKSKRRGPSAEDDKTTVTADSDFSQGKKKGLEKRRLPSWFFQRSFSYQPPQASTWKTSRVQTSMSIEEEREPSSSFHPTSKTLPKSASDHVFDQPIGTIDAPRFAPSQNVLKCKNISEITLDNKSVSSKTSDPCKEHSSGCYDDEVFM